MCRSPIGFLFALIAGDGGIFEGAPVWLVAFQRQLLGPAGQVEGHYNWLKLSNQAAVPGNSFHPLNLVSEGRGVPITRMIQGW